jgi:RNA polymerase sigma-70 factor (ECF subfamily)
MQANGRRELALKDDKLNAICEREESVSNPASSIPDSMALRIMLDKLEPKRRASLLLAIIDGRTHEEIAKYLGVPVGTVKAWIRRELVSMRRQLTACVGESRGDGVVIRTRDGPVANPKGVAKPCPF